MSKKYMKNESSYARVVNLMMNPAQVAPFQVHLRVVTKTKEVVDVPWLLNVELSLLNAQRRNGDLF